MKRVVVPEYLPEHHLGTLRERFDVAYDPDLYDERPKLLDLVANASAILIRNRTLIDSELLSAAGELRVVGRLGVGLDNIDVEACTGASVKVIPAAGANAVAVAEYVIGAMLVLVRGVFGMTESMLTGSWPRQGHAFGRELAGKTLGLVGYGSIGREVGLRAAALGMKIVAHDPYVADDDPSWRAALRVTLDELLAVSDVVSVHTRLTTETRNLIDAPALKRMKPDAILINTSRGGTVDEEALALALRTRLIGGAALDVFAVEPLPPETAARFSRLDNLLLTPHLAGNTAEAVDRVADMIVQAVSRELAG